MGSEAGLLGSWSATRWHHTAIARPDQAVDLVCDLGGTVTLSLSADTYVLAWDIPGRESRSVGGPWALRAGLLDFDSPDFRFRESVAYHLNGGLLTITSENSAWEFADGDGPEPTHFVGVFVKL